MIKVTDLYFRSNKRKLWHDIDFISMGRVYTICGRTFMAVEGLRISVEGYSPDAHRILRVMTHSGRCATCLRRAKDREVEK